MVCVELGNHLTWRLGLGKTFLIPKGLNLGWGYMESCRWVLSLSKWDLDLALFGWGIFGHASISIYSARFKIALLSFASGICQVVTALCIHSDVVLLFN